MAETMPAVIRVSDLLGMRVRSADDDSIGRVVDVVVGAHPAVSADSRLIVRTRRGLPLAVTTTLVNTFAVPGRELRLSGPPGGPVPCGQVTTEPDHDQPTELFLGRDVLDSQVIDLAGVRLARVSEVFLAIDEGNRLTPVSVDLGLGSLVSRMGLGSVGRRLPELVADWDDVYLASTVGHRVELSVSPHRLQHLDAQAVAEVIARLRTDQATDVLRVVSPTTAATALAVSHHQLRTRLLAVAGGRRASAMGRRFLRSSGWHVRRPATDQR